MHRPLNRSLAGALILFCLAVPSGASAAQPRGALPAAPTVLMRIEGATKTLLAQTSVRTTSATEVKGNPCSGSSVGGALDVATHGAWDGTYSSKFNDYTVTSILGESHPFSGPTYWTLWVNGLSSSTGACSTPLHQGDRVLWYVCHPGGPPSYNCLNGPLALTVPASARAGKRVTVTVVQLDGSGHSKAASGAKVSGDGISTTTGAGGRATFVPEAAGTLTIQARKAGATPSDPVSVCISSSLHGVCETAGKNGPPVHLIGISEHQVLLHGPRMLRGSAGPDPAGITDLRLSLFRRAFGGACSYFDGDHGIWRGTKCASKTTPTFSAGAGAVWSYLLPAALAPGSYRLEVVARDGAGRRTKLVTGVSRIDFVVSASVHK